ncbi:UvrD-helicase domain-containing protein [Spongiactinospora sp. TRM90649]|uniref:UvrD-helicase domain-containing protein n=1 Tax=Spongiactinospora sp. TRM90649 TaxID=3031114 RepID=UPI0023F821DA|nr:UvrD-helicase domain-containing protein [Spongiactinospora sp. TRM90649]MDF5755554.1 AAA family ATPase [Spongiactinospora sp. TRM90649]
MAELALSREFLDGYDKLEKRVRKLVKATISKFGEHTFAGLHLEKLENAVDPNVRTIRIDRFWRGVILKPDQGDVYCMLAVLPHDEAIRYARGRRFTVNQALGVLEVRNEVALNQVRPALEETARKMPDRLFAHIGDADLRRLGIDDDLMPLVRLLTEEAHLMALERILPAAQRDALIALASGMSVDEALAEIGRLLVSDRPPRQVDAGDLVAAMERTPGEIAFVSGSEELAWILEHPFTAWRVFLHPAQRKIAYRESYSGPVQVTGGAGTGKTVTALHRAKHLAAHGNGPILVTTFTKTLAATLAQQLDLLVDDPGLREKITVTHVDKLANSIATADQGRPIKIIGPTEEAATWAAASAHARLNHRPAFLRWEWDQIVLGQDIRDERTYLSCDRRGRGGRLSADERRRVWLAIEAFTGELRRSGYHTHRQVAEAAARIMAATPVKPYRHVIVDEAQDLHPAQWRLLRAVVEPGPDDIFLVGDPHQRIYDNRVSLTSLGIAVRGRSHRLKLNYRTTQEILTWAVRVLGLDPVPSLTGEPDSLTGYHSTLHGQRPAVARFGDKHTELAALSTQVQEWINDGVEPHAIGVTARTSQLAGRVSDALRSAGIDSIPLAATDASPRSVRVGSMHRMKGLEFRCVAVVGLNHDVLPSPSAVTPAEEDGTTHRQDLQRERCLLFVACTRARDSLYVSYHGDPSAFLPR